MKATFYMLYICTLFVSTIFASQDSWRERYQDVKKSRLYMILTKGFDKRSTTLHSRVTLWFIRDSKNIKTVQDVLKGTSKSPFDLYSILIETLHPEFAEQAKGYYKEQRDLSKVSAEFNESDAKFYKKLDTLTESFFYGVNWDKLRGLTSKEEVMCEAAFFYGLIDFERTVTCLDAVPPVASLTCDAFSNFVADMYFGEAKRPDFSYEGDTETRKWLNDMIKKYEGSYHHHTTSLMRRFTQSIRGKMNNKLWNDYMRAMMTVYLSAALLEIKTNGLKDLYDYLADNSIHDEYMFASKFEDSKDSHAFLRTFKLDSNSETATMGIINSGDGIESHDMAQFNLSELPDTIAEEQDDDSVDRYIPFVVYDAVPRSAWGPAYTIVDSVDKAYFEHKQKKHRFDNYQRWQYIDDQRGGTCSAMSLWSALYWFERESQQKLESFRLELYLEVLKEAAKELIKLRTELEELDTQRSESVDEHKWDELQRMIKEKSETEDDYLRFFSVAFNSAIRSIRYLHYDPFGQGLDMTAVMQDYADFYESQAGKKYWQFVKPNIDDLFHSTYLRVVNPMIWVAPLNLPKISILERVCVDEVNQAIKAKDPFNFVKVVTSGTDLKCQSKSFLALIHFGVDSLNLQTHHQELILRALAKEVLSLSGGRLPILRLIHKLINDYNFKLFPTYDIQPTETTDFTKNIYQIVLFEDDTELKQFAINCAAFDLVGKNVLAAANELVSHTWKTLMSLAIQSKLRNTEEFKLFKSIIQHIATELQSMDPHIYAQHLGNLIRNAKQTGIADQIGLFKPSDEWNRDDYELLERATEECGSPGEFIKMYIDQFYNLMAGRELASKYLPSLPSNLSEIEYICVGKMDRAIKANSSLSFVKAIISDVEEKCKSELFTMFITLGAYLLPLQSYHHDLILRALAWHENASQMLKLVDKLITKHGFKLLPTDNTPPTMNNYNVTEFFSKASELKDDAEVRQFVADLNKNKSLARIILKLCTKHEDLVELRARFVDHVLKELQAMNPHLLAYHLSHLINQKALIPDDFASIKLPKGWNDYDYVLIENAIISNPRRREYYKIFNPPKVYHIDIENAPHESEFELMSANPSDETLKRYATMLFKKIKGGQRE